MNMNNRKRAEKELHNSFIKLERNKAAALNLLEDLMLEIEERKHAEVILRIIAESGVPPGEDIFRFLVRQLANSLNKRYALIAVIDAGDTETARTIAVWNKDGFADNFSYALAGTPCQEVSTSGSCLYPRDIQKLFPEARRLAEMGAESYWGTPLRDSGGNVIGLMAVIDDRPMDESPHVLTLLNSFAFRAAAEIDRRKTEDNYQILFREMLDGFAVHEIVCDKKGNPTNYRFLAVNPAFEKMTGFMASDIIGKSVLEVLPETGHFWIDTYRKAALTGKPVLFESYFRELSRYFEVKAFRPQTNQFVCIFTDVSQIMAKEEKADLVEGYQIFKNGSLPSIRV